MTRGERLAARIEAWLALEARERAAVAAGLRSATTPPEIASHRERYADLADPRLAETIAEAAAEAEPGTAEARHHADLTAACARFRRLYARRELDQRLAALTSTLTGVVGGKAIRYPDLLALRRATGERRARAAIDRTLERLAAEHLAPLAQARFRPAPAAGGAPAGGDPGAASLITEAGTLLAATNERLHHLLPRLLERLGEVEITDAKAHDLEPVRRAEILDRHFPRQSELDFARTIVERGLGLDLTAAGGIHLDLAPHAGRALGVRTEAIRVPDEVHVVGRPLGGVGDAEALLGALGPALAAAHTDRTLEMELRLLGDEAVSTAFRALFAGILHERSFGEPRLGADRELYFERGMTLDLIQLRAVAARVPLESAPDLPADQALAAAASAALGLSIAPSVAWLELDPDRGAETELRGFALAAVLRQELRSSFGENWFESRRAGRYLRDIWSCGRRYDAEELAREVGASGLRWDLVRDDLVGSTA
jgi:hypothetical protein